MSNPCSDNRRLHPCGIARLAVLGNLLALLCAFLAPAFGMAPIEQAEVVIELADGTAASGAAPIHLPFNWDTAQGGVDGRARIVARFSVSDPRAPHGLFIARIGNAFEVRLNGVLLGAKGTGNDRYEDYSKQPQFFRIPDGLLQHDNALAITVHAQGGRRAGVSAPLIGPLDEATRLFEESYGGVSAAFSPCRS